MSLHGPTQRRHQDSAAHRVHRQRMGGFLAADGLPFVMASQCILADGYMPALFDPWRRPDWSTQPELAEVRLTRSVGMPSGLARACMAAH